MKTSDGSISCNYLVTQLRYVKLLCCLFLSCWVVDSFGQERLVLNGAIVTLNEGAYLVIDNPQPTAITRNSGHIISEGGNNIIKWNIGTTTGTYTVPWGYGSCDCIALTFTKTAGTGSGYFLFSTYPTPWNNSSQLPSGVNNINGPTGLDNSSFVVDRFWQVNALGYSVKPALSNLEFTYRDAENAVPNTITESLLRAKRYNSALNSWVDEILSSSINTSTNKITISSVDAGNLHAWWTLGTLNSNRYWVASSGSTSNDASNWSETAGGAGNAGAPIPGDAIFFDGSSNYSCVLDADISASSLTVTSAFSGVITQGTKAISVDGNAIFSGGTFVGGSGDISVGGDFTVSGASFTAPSATLDVKKNFSVTSGTFSHNNGTLSFSGSSGTQTLTSASALTLNNIAVSNTSASPGVVVESNQNLKGVLTLASNVVFDSDGTNNSTIFKLISTADSPTQDASIATLPSGAQVSGKVTVQRFMSKEAFNSNRVYRYISSPIQSATVADLQQEIPITGTFTGRNSCSGCVASSQSMFAYSEPVITDTDRNGIANLHDGYIDFPNTSNTETFEAGKGYALYVRGNLLSSTLWDLRGTINSGNVTPISLPVSYTSSGTLENDGWNLVGNPFPSSIDWDAASGWTKTNLETSIYITDNSSAEALKFATWNGVTGTNGGSQYIAMGQGFWVKANGNGTPVLQANENVKAAGTQTTFFRKISSENLLRITLSKGTVKDETVIHFRKDATEVFDNHADARKLPNTVVNISSILGDGKLLAINSISPINCSASIPLSIDNVGTGNYALAFSEVESFHDNLAITLTDSFADSTFNIRNGNYAFSVTSDAKSYGPSRFKINFNTIPLDTTIMASVSDVCAGKDAIVQIGNAQAGVTYEAVLDKSVFPSTNQNGVGVITLPKDKLVAGQNSFIIKSSLTNCSATVENQFYLNVHPLYAPVVSGGQLCEQGAVALIASGAPANGIYNWYDDASSTTAIDSHDSIFLTPPLKKSKTYYVSIANTLGCEGPRTAAHATIVNPDPVVIYSDNQSLTSSYTSGNQWFFNGKKIEEETHQSIQPTQSGIYKIETVVEGCVTSSEIAFTVIPANVPPSTSEEVPIDTTTTVEEGPTVSPIPENFPASHVMQISPNPVRETALLEISNDFKQVKEVRIISGLGQFMGIVNIQQVGDLQTGTLQMRDFPPGVYIIQIFSNSGMYERKLIKQ